ncbi:hypothetical protein GGS24DRAFT_464777 [Hypoxylon argillaceum]|nr:hypothetical protein GGS24DRAFT_464777 [Hypoxylon argillaceum]
MYLGVKSLWRARSCVRLVQGLSLLPRESRNLPFSSALQTRCWLSSLAEPSPPVGVAEGAGDAAVLGVEGKQAERGVVRKCEVGGRPKARPKVPATASYSALWRRFVKRVQRTQELGSLPAPMIKRSIEYKTRYGSSRSRKKYMKSVGRQALHEYAREALHKPRNDWRWTFDFMIRSTPKFGEVLDFKVGIGRAAAARARASLSKLDTNLWQIQQRHKCKIRIESTRHEDAPLILSLSGTTVSIRDALLELVSVVGKVTAVRVLDPSLQISSPEIWKGANLGERPIRLLQDGESAVEDETVTVYGHNIDNIDFFRMAQRPRLKPYQLTIRADEIPRPTVWTTSSFEQYVAKLVLAQVPTHLHQSLYPVGLNHQGIVVQLLTGLFTSEDLRAAVSLSAMKMALRYIHARDPLYRPAARSIFYQVELLHLPLDAETFQSFLISASKAGDLQGFNSVLKAMHRKGLYAGVETWTAFLAMIQDPKIKLFIMKKMKSRGLHRLQPILAEMGRQNMLIELERRPNPGVKIQRIMQGQDKNYGTSWLNTITLNRMINVIGSRGDLGACYELLDLVERDQRTRPDQYTLNTMVVHTRSIPQRIALLSRLPRVEPDSITYGQFFHVAWKQRLPNMLRVIWRYAVFANTTYSHMRYTLTLLLRPELVLSNNRAFLKAWEDVIFGRSELAAGRLSVSGTSRQCGSLLLMEIYKKNAGGQQPLVGLAAKLQEAYEMDMKIHKMNKEVAEFTPEMMDSLTVDIPMGFKRRARIVAPPNPANSGIEGNAAE